MRYIVSFILLFALFLPCPVVAGAEVSVDARRWASTLPINWRGSDGDLTLVLSEEQCRYAGYLMHILAQEANEGKIVWQDFKNQRLWQSTVATRCGSIGRELEAAWKHSDAPVIPSFLVGFCEPKQKGKK